jgi:hypothetical protein
LTYYWLPVVAVVVRADPLAAVAVEAVRVAFANCPLFLFQRELLTPSQSAAAGLAAQA